MSDLRSAAALFRAVGLLPDGPVLWGRSLPRVEAGVVVFELPEAAETAPIDPARVGKWLERVPTLRLDGTVPTTRRLVARLARYWLAGERIVFIGCATSGLGRRVAALAETPLGIRPPLPDAHWLLALRHPERLRIWWAASDAAEEYADALLDAFADGIPPAVVAALPEPELVLPWATLRRPTGEARQHGLVDDLLERTPDPVALERSGSRSGRGLTPTRPGPGRRAAAPVAAATGPRRRSNASAPGGTAGAAGPRVEAVHLSADGLERLRAELDQLRQVERPAVIARVRSARELGDLRENAEYQAAREEQSFLEGRIRALEDRLRRAVVVERTSSPTTVGLGSVVIVEIDDRQERFELVGPAEADPAAGRLSIRSPIGAALLGAEPGTERVVATPSGERRLRILAVE